MREIVILMLDLRASPDHIGSIPDMLDAEDPRKAAEQLDIGYAHGGGWSPTPGFTMDDSGHLKYPGDPPLAPLAAIPFREEIVLIYEHSIVAVIQPDGSFEVSRMD